MKTVFDCLAIDRTSKVVLLNCMEEGHGPSLLIFRGGGLPSAYRIHTILTDNDIQFTRPPRQKYAFKHVSDRICTAHGIDHRLSKPNHPWTHGQVERVNRSLKDATVHRYHYETHQQLQEHLDTFILAYNLAKRLKTLGGLTRYEYNCQQWQKQPELFLSDPFHRTLGLYT